jgi:hypothetical protein
MRLLLKAVVVEAGQAQLMAATVAMVLILVVAVVVEELVVLLLPVALAVMVAMLRFRSGCSASNLYSTQ